MLATGLRMPRVLVRQRDPLAPVSSRNPSPVSFRCTCRGLRCGRASHSLAILTEAPSIPADARALTNPLACVGVQGPRSVGEGHRARQTPACRATSPSNCGAYLISNHQSNVRSIGSCASSRRRESCHAIHGARADIPAVSRHARARRGGARCGRLAAIEAGYKQ